MVFVATPDHLHTAPILDALRHGCHVVTEKPMCLDLNEADEIIAAAEAARADRRRGHAQALRPRPPQDLRRAGRPDLGTPALRHGVLEEPLEVSTSTFKWVEQSDPFSYVGIHWADVFMHYLKLDAALALRRWGRSSACAASSARTPSTPSR